jgi:soluble P-type ATPase
LIHTLQEYDVHIYVAGSSETVALIKHTHQCEHCGVPTSIVASSQQETSHTTVSDLKVRSKYCL